MSPGNLLYNYRQSLIESYETDWCLFTGQVDSIDEEWFAQNVANAIHVPESISIFGSMGQRNICHRLSDFFQCCVKFKRTLRQTGHWPRRVSVCRRSLSNSLTVSNLTPFWKIKGKASISRKIKLLIHLNRATLLSVVS